MIGLVHLLCYFSGPIAWYKGLRSEDRIFLHTRKWEFARLDVHHHDTWWDLLLSATLNSSPCSILFIMLACSGLNAWNFLMSSVYYVSTQDWSCEHYSGACYFFLSFKALYYYSGTSDSPGSLRILISHASPDNMTNHDQHKFLLRQLLQLYPPHVKPATCTHGSLLNRSFDLTSAYTTKIMLVPLPEGHCSVFTEWIKWND